MTGPTSLRGGMPEIGSLAPFDLLCSRHKRSKGSGADLDCTGARLPFTHRGAFKGGARPSELV